MEEVKRIPYGVSNFVEVVEQNQYYVDKTIYLPLLEEQPSNLFFIRPRRFGKSIFLSMLRTYYDIAQKEKFEKRFSNLWIGSRPTQLQGTFQILFLDFSRVGGLDRTLAENFDDYCCGGLDDFASIYEPYYYPGFEEEMKAQYGTTNKLNFLDRKARNNGSKLYLIVDEYDNFTNVVLNEQGDKVYHALTHASGFYREIFKKFKGMFERIFMTGVSEIFDNLEVVKLSDEKVKSFDNIKCGVDFGFAADPFVYVVCFYHNNKLFIFDEIYAKGMTNHNAAEKIFEKGFANKLIVCDSAEPKSINDLRMFGLRVRGARKGPDSIEYGIRFLQSLEKIVIDPERCPNVTREFSEYELERDTDGEFKSVYPDKNNHTIDAVRYALEDKITKKKARVIKRSELDL